LLAEAVAGAADVAGADTVATDTVTLAVVSTAGRGSARMSWFDAGLSN